MVRDNKILIASGLLGRVVSVAKAAPTSTDDMLNSVKAEFVPLIVNTAGLWILFKLIK